MSELEPVSQEPDQLPLGLLCAILFGSLACGGLGVLVSRQLGAPLTWRSDYSTPPRAPAALGMAEQSLLTQGMRGERERRKARRELESYHWQSRELGIARIPIERAIDLSLER